MSKKKTTKTDEAAKTRRTPGVTNEESKRVATTQSDSAPVATPPKSTKVDVSAAKGRPMLTWVGKRPLSYVTAFPAQLVERHDALRIAGIDAKSLEPNDEKTQLFKDLRSQCNEECWKDAPFINGVWAPEVGGVLLHGDNKDVLAFLLAHGYRGKVDLIYIDPPFDSGADYVRQVRLRGVARTSKLSAESLSLGEQIQYTDIWVNDNYLQLIFERLLLLKELLCPGGSIYVHCDDRKSHHIRCLLDEALGSDNYRNEIVWKRTTARSGSGTYNHIHDTLLYYTKGDDFAWNQQYLDYSEEYLQTNFKPDESGRLFRETPITAPGTRIGKPSGEPWKGLDPSTIGRGRHWAIPSFLKPLVSEHAKNDPIAALNELEALGRIRWARDGGGRPNAIQYEDDLEGTELQSIWTDFGAVASNATESEDYPTQKPAELLRRIVLASSKPGDLVLDAFLGSGTTASVSQALGRRWIGCDINKGAIRDHGEAASRHRRRTNSVRT